MGLEEQAADLAAQVQVAIALAQEALFASQDNEENGEFGLERDEIYDEGRWPGEVIYIGRRFYDADLQSDTTGTAITDNSTAWPADTHKKFIKVDFSSNVVTYEDGPVPYVSGDMPQDEEWFEVSFLVGPLHVPGR
tara:strand:- start:1216 stop:1623 length:408 start_codon:yes stop_codon:yes gene_type:complete